MRTMFCVILLTFLISSAFAESGMGIGPIKTVTINPTVDKKMAEAGKAVFKTKCSQCHKIEKRYTGPQLLAVTKRRKPEWIMNMILNPMGMTKQDPTAMKLQQKFLVQMANQNVGETNARAILEFFRDNDKNLTQAQIDAVLDGAK